MSGVPLERMDGAAKLAAGEAYCLALHFGRLGETAHEERLLEIEAARADGLAARLALKRLVRALGERSDQEGILALNGRLPGRIESDGDIAPLLMGALYEKGDEASVKRAAALASSIVGGKAPRAPYGAVDAYAYLASRRIGPPYAGPGLDDFAFGKTGADALAPLARALAAETVAERPSSLILIEARNLVVSREFHKARERFDSLPGADSLSRLSTLLKEGAAREDLISEAGRAWLNGGGEAEGEALFSALAAKSPDGDGAKGQALLVAARCARATGRKDGAVLLFKYSFNASARGRVKDAAAWFLADIALEVSPKVAAAELERTMPEWSDIEYFSDVLGKTVSGLARQKAFTALESLGAVADARGGTAVGDRIAYILMRASVLGYGGKNGLSERVFADPLGYYAIMASVIRGRDPVPPALRAAKGPLAPLPESTASEPAASPRAGAEELALIDQLMEFGLSDEVPSLPATLLSAIGDADIRALAARLHYSGRYYEGLRMANRLTWKKSYAAEAGDFALLYPRGYAREIDAAAAERGVEAALIFGLVRTESAFDPDAVSKSGARGLTQLMPETAEQVASALGMDGADPFSPADNIAMGVSYFSQLMRRASGDALLAALCYNGGPTRLMRLRSASPSLPTDFFLETIDIGETREYGKKVLAAAAVYGYLIEGREFEDAVKACIPGFPSRATD